MPTAAPKLDMIYDLAAGPSDTLRLERHPDVFRYRRQLRNKGWLQRKQGFLHQKEPIASLGNIAFHNPGPATPMLTDFLWR